MELSKHLDPLLACARNKTRFHGWNNCWSFVDSMHWAVFSESEKCKFDQSEVLFVVNVWQHPEHSPFCDFPFPDIEWKQFRKDHRSDTFVVSFPPNQQEP